MSENPFPVWPYVRIPMGMRMRLVADAINATKHAHATLKKDAPAMQQRRVFRLAMEKQKRRKLRLWRENVR